MTKSNVKKTGAVLVTAFFVSLALLSMVPGATNEAPRATQDRQPTRTVDDFLGNERLGTAQPYDTIHVPVENVALSDEENDLGYNCDAGNSILKSLPIYVGEPVQPTVPGRGRTGQLNPGEGDRDDWFLFTACQGQTVQLSLSTAQDFGCSLVNTEAAELAIPYTVEKTGLYFLHVFSRDGAEAGDYTLSISLQGQNDAGSGKDAGNTMTSALAVDAGSYTGYMAEWDREDWYRIQVSAGQGITVTVTPLEKSDYDIHLYNPSGQWVHSATYYGEDTLTYNADVSGTWYVQLDMFPGWDTEKWPQDYFLYGSGAYELDINVGGSVEGPPEPRSQPEIYPVARTFIVDNYPTGNADEYAYLAAVPAANYIEDGKRYVSPIVYQGEDYVPNWYLTVDDTTQYLLDDWNHYLARHGMTAEEHHLDGDPSTAAAQLATSLWTSSNTAVIAVDGSGFTDTVTNVVDQSATLNIQTSAERISADSPKLKDVGGNLAAPMFIGSKWGAIHLTVDSATFAGDTGLITPRYEPVMEDWWPYPYDGNGPDSDTFYPVTIPGLWAPYVTSSSGLSEFVITKYAGDRYRLPVDDSASSLNVTITTDQPSNLIVYLVDPSGNVRRPSYPHWVGEPNPIHEWNGGHWRHDQDEFRAWRIEPHTEFSVEVHYPMEGTWTAIVVPYYGGDTSGTVDYHITAQMREHSPDRTAAALSAANAAVIASLNHAPLLYVTKDEVPTVTSEALSTLGASNLIFVNINEVSGASLSGATEYTTLQQAIDAIKAHQHSENFITVTSLGTGDGYFAPAAMAAAYHGAPVINMGDAPDAYNTLDMIESWREYAGDYYHGCRSLGHLPQMAEPIDWWSALQDFLSEQEIPPVGLDLKLRWYGGVYDGMYNLISSYGLDREGKEVYLFVSPRDTDIRDPICRAMEGNNSYGGHIPVTTPAFSSAVIVRGILYPAIIYANPGRDVATSQMMNYPDGYQWRCNDGSQYANRASQELKRSFSSRGRFYEGHCIWDNLLERYNAGAAISYYSGHGTGGSGISAQYKNVAEQWPYAELRYEHLMDFDWWDGWRGYSGYDDKQTKTPRWGGESGYNAQEPNLYDIIHFKWVDQALGNLHSEMEFWSSCTTGSHFGPIVYLSHGSAIWMGAAGSTYGIQDDLHNNWMFYDVLVKGESLGESHSRYLWMFNRDFGTKDPTTLYGPSTLFQLSQGGLTNVGVLFGDPTMTCYAPDWTEPVPILS